MAFLSLFNDAQCDFCKRKYDFKKKNLIINQAGKQIKNMKNLTSGLKSKNEKNLTVNIDK